MITFVRYRPRCSFVSSCMRAPNAFHAQNKNVKLSFSTSCYQRAKTSLYPIAVSPISIMTPIRTISIRIALLRATDASLGVDSLASALVLSTIFLSPRREFATGHAFDCANVRSICTQADTEPLGARYWVATADPCRNSRSIRLEVYRLVFMFRFRRVSHFPAS